MDDEEVVRVWKGVRGVGRGDGVSCDESGVEGAGRNEEECARFWIAAMSASRRAAEPKVDFERIGLVRVVVGEGMVRFSVEAAMRKEGVLLMVVVRGRPEGAQVKVSLSVGIRS